MKNILEKYKIELNSKEITKFKEFLQIFIEKNSKINLSAIRSENDIIEKHFIDSIVLNIFIELR
jgi:16S rRNA (guanine527-N7)-methyltransferase